MILLPNCPCCSTGCTSADSDGEGTFFEDFFEYADQAAAETAGWAFFESTGALTPPDVTFSGTSITTDQAGLGRCTYIDLTQDAQIEIEVDASTVGSGGTNYGSPPLFGFGVALSSFLDAGTLGSPTVVGWHNPLAGNSGADQLRLMDYPFYPEIDSDNFFFGGSLLSYRLVLDYVAGAWSATYSVNATAVFTAVDCPDFSLPDNRFYHGFYGNDASQTITRYYMKLTYL